MEEEKSYKYEELKMPLEYSDVAISEFSGEMFRMRMFDRINQIGRWHLLHINDGREPVGFEKKNLWRIIKRGRKTVAKIS